MASKLLLSKSFMDIVQNIVSMKKLESLSIQVFSISIEGLSAPSPDLVFCLETKD